MSVREQVTKMNLATLFASTITTNDTVQGTPVDGADDELGLSFFLGLSGYTDGNYSLSLEDSADDGSGAPLGDWTAIPDKKIVFGGSDTPGANGVQSANGVVTSGETALGESHAKIGVFSERRWVRPVILSVAVTVGVTLATVSVVKHSEYLVA
jgi:hypothetical protein